MLSLRYDELIGKIKEHEAKKQWMDNYNMPHKVLDKIKETIDIIKLDGTKIMIKADDKLPD